MAFPGRFYIRKRANIRKSVSHPSHPAHLGPIITEVIIRLSGLVAGDSGLTSYKSDLDTAAWLPGLVTVENGLASYTDCYRSWIRVLFFWNHLSIVYLYIQSHKPKTA